MSIDAPDASDKKISDILPDIAEQMAFFATIFVFASIVHEYLYFGTIGRDFTFAYSITDFAKMTMTWLPSAVMLGAFGFIINFFDLNARFEAVKTHGERGLEPWQGPDRAMSYLVKFLLVAIIIGLPFLNWDTISMLQIPVLLGMISLVGRQIANGRLSITERPAETMMLYFFLVWIIVTALFGGLSEGIKDIKRNEPIYSIYLKNSAIDAVILRSIDKGILLRIPKENKIILASWGDIVKLQSPTVIISNSSISTYIKSFFNK